MACEPGLGDRFGLRCLSRQRGVAAPELCATDPDTVVRAVCECVQCGDVHIAVYESLTHINRV